MFIAWLGLFPFVLLYGAYEGPKVLWLWIGGFFLSLWWLVKKQKPRRSWFLIWIFVLLFASLVGIHPLESIIGGGYRHQGVLFFFTLFLIGETVPTLSFQWKKILIAVLSCGVMLESVVVIIQKITDWQARSLGTFGEPNAVAGFLAIGLFLIIRMKWKAAILLVIISIIATGSRTGIIAACIVFCGLLGRKKYAVVALGIVSIVVIGFSRPYSLYENRPLFWRIATKAILQKPIFGYGAESSEYVFTKMFEKENIHLYDLVIERSHNIFLDVAMWSGIVGLVVFCRWVWEMIRRSRHPWIIVAWILFACFQPVGVVHWIGLILLSVIY